VRKRSKKAALISQEKQYEEVDPKRQTMEALHQLLAKTTTENRLRENASSILQLFSDLPPYSLFHEDDNETLDAFGTLLTSVLNGRHTTKAKGRSQQGVGPLPRTQVDNSLYLKNFLKPRRLNGRGGRGGRDAPNDKQQVITLLLILALMRGSVKASLDALMYLLEPATSEPVLEEGLPTTIPLQQDLPHTTVTGSDVSSVVKGRQEILRSVVPYLKQLVDYRKHKELSSLFEEAYQGKIFFLIP